MIDLALYQFAISTLVQGLQHYQLATSVYLVVLVLIVADFLAPLNMQHVSK